MGAGSSSTEIKALNKRITAIQPTIDSLSDIRTKIEQAATSAAAAINYDDLSMSITVDYPKKLADPIVDDPGNLSVKLAESLISSNTVLGSISTNLQDNTKFAETIATTLTNSDQYKSLIRGDAGLAGTLGTETGTKDTLWTSKYTLWCADKKTDGAFINACKVPDGNRGIKINNSVMDGKDGDWVRLLGNPDDLDNYNRGVAVTSLWAKDSLNLGNRNILGELNDLRTKVNNIRNAADNIVIRNDRQYEINAMTGQTNLCLNGATHGSGGTCDWNSGSRRFRFQNTGRGAW